MDIFSFSPPPFLSFICKRILNKQVDAFRDKEENSANESIFDLRGVRK